MKVSALPKKEKNALSKVSKNKVIKKREKAGGLGKKGAVILQSAAELFPTTEKRQNTETLKKATKAMKNPSVDSPIVSKKKMKLAIKSVETTEKGADSPVVTKSLKKKMKKVAGSPVVTTSLKKTAKTVEDSPVIIKSAKKTAKKVTDSPVVTKSLKKKIKKIADSPVVTQSAGMIKPISDSSVASISLQKRIQPKPISKKTLAAKIHDEVSLNEDLLNGVCASALKLVNKTDEGQEKKDLFGSLGQPINLQLVLYRVVKTPKHNFRCSLPNSVFPTEPDVLLILPDLKRGRFRDVTFAKYLEEYEELLNEAGIKGIKQIIPFTQLRAEYSQFELKRRLVNSFDILLCDGRIEGHCTKFLGNALPKCNKVLTPVKALVDDKGVKNASGKRNAKFHPNLQKQVDRACHTVTLKLMSKGTTCNVKVGHSQMSEKQLAENCKAIWNFMNLKMPGGHRNVKSAYLRGHATISVPVYCSLAPPPSEIPVVKSIRRNEAVEDELSTQPGVQVVVRKNGRITIKNQQTAEDLQFIENLLGPEGGDKRSKKNRRKQNKRDADKSSDADSDENGSADGEVDSDADGDVEGNVDGDVEGDVDGNVDSDDGEDDLAFMARSAAEERAYMKRWSAAALEEEEKESKPAKTTNKRKGKNAQDQEETPPKKVKKTNAQKKGTGKKSAKKGASKA